MNFRDTTPALKAQNNTLESRDHWRSLVEWRISRLQRFEGSCTPPGVLPQAITFRTFGAGIGVLAAALHCWEQLRWLGGEWLRYFGRPLLRGPPLKLPQLPLLLRAP